MGIAIVEFILFCIFFVVGVQADCLGLTMFVWVFVAVISASEMKEADKKTSTLKNIERLKREIEQDNKEWDEWRHMYQDKNK